MATRQVGTVVKWMNHRGIGFICPDGEASEIGKDLLVHFSNIKQDTTESSFKSLAQGSRVEFDTASDPKNPDKLIAVNVTGIGGVDCERRVTRARASNANAAFQLTIANLTDETSWRDVKDLFRSCGYVDWVDVKDSTGFVRYTTEADALKAVERYNGFNFNGNEITVTMDAKKE